MVRSFYKVKDLLEFHEALLRYDDLTLLLNGTFVVGAVNSGRFIQSLGISSSILEVHLNNNILSVADRSNTKYDKRVLIASGHPELAEVPRHYHHSDPLYVKVPVMGVNITDIYEARFFMP